MEVLDVLACVLLVYLIVKRAFLLRNLLIPTMENAVIHTTVNNLLHLLLQLDLQLDLMAVASYLIGKVGSPVIRFTLEPLLPICGVK
jgi:hypothetical protein